MDRLGSLRGFIGHDSELNLVTQPVLGPEQDVGLERPEAGTRSEDNTLASGGTCVGGLTAPPVPLVGVLTLLGLGRPL